MGDIMRPVPFEELLTRIFDEYQQHHSIFGIPEQQFYSPANQRRVSVFGESCATPIGPAAGPHTQLAQNIITAWLTGGRFIELKTVQILDRLELENPASMPKTNALTPNGLRNLRCKKRGMSILKHGLFCICWKRFSHSRRRRTVSPLFSI